MKTISDYERETEIGNRWLPIVQAAEMYDPAMTAANLFMLAGAIMKDPIVSAAWVGRAQKLGQPTGDCAPSPYVTLLRGLSPEDRRALQERIQARHFGAFGKPRENVRK